MDRLITLIFLTASAGALGAQPPGYFRVQQAEVVVRSGPSESAYAVGKLRLGETVLVLRSAAETPGWLAIRPPLGSFSWIDVKHLKVLDKVALVEGDPLKDVTIFAGSSLTAQEPSVPSANIRPGFLVNLTGPPMTTSARTMVPIAVMPNEVRWIPAKGVVALETPAASAPALAPPGPGEVAVIAASVDVRSGPGDNYQPTTRLKLGDRVAVLRPGVNPQWLAIKPPPGSFSWVSGKHIQINERSGTLKSDGKTDIPILPGSQLSQQAPAVESVRARAGTKVYLMDRPLRTSDGNTWYPIQPLAEEVRWLPASALPPGSAGPVPMPLPPEKK